MAINQTTSSNIEYIGGQDMPGGKVLGYSADDKVGFFGVTPVVQQSVTAPATATATTTINEAYIARIAAALVNLGLIVTT